MVQTLERTQVTKIEWLGKGVYSLAPDGVWRSDRVQFVYSQRRYLQRQDELPCPMLITNVQRLVACTFANLGLGRVSNSISGLNRHQAKTLWQLGRQYHISVDVQQEIIPQRWGRKPIMRYTVSARWLESTAEGAYPCL